MAGSFYVFLKDEKLRTLANVIRLGEIREMYPIRFASPGEQHQYMLTVNGNMTAVYSLLDECNLLAEKYKADGVRSPIAGQILVYAEHCLNNALQLFRNFTLRKDYLDKLTEHQHEIFQALNELDTTSRSSVSELADTIREYDQMVVAHMLLNLNSHASAEFSQYIRNIGITFDELVKSNQAKLGFPGKFENLEDEQKLEVYNEICNISGRMNGVAAIEGVKGVDEEVLNMTRSTISYGKKKSKFKSAGMFLMDMGIIIWDVYSSGHTMTEAVRAAVITAAEAGGAALGKVIGVAVAKMVGVAATSVFAAAAGLVFGFIGAFIVGLVAGLVFDAIFGSGGEKPVPEEDSRVYVSDMPDGHLLARQIAAL
ncbi:hypothetical protein PHJA_001347900 [Phtheirospermum japonicum]|uniref:Uncharacterized protein n=1 Tax=Phtheirospermum japonicum TaxID=374723 RepID=A0A830C4J0_9LAMI|nr:hypothetical protein PHJA_001347900 [Phtheirospermum japonicum]